MSERDHQLTVNPPSMLIEGSSSKPPASPVLLPPAPKLRSSTSPETNSGLPVPLLPPNTVFPAPVASFKSQGRGNNGKGDNPLVGNADFISAVFSALPQNASAAICSKVGDPTSGGWIALRAETATRHCHVDSNNYINCSSFIASDDRIFKARKDNFIACHFLLLDDLGGKLPLDRLAGFEPSWLLETSPGNYQAGIILAEPITQAQTATGLLDAIIAAGLCDPGASGPLSRWARLPVGINGKPKHVNDKGEAFRCRLVQWRPEKRYHPEELVASLRLKIASPEKQRAAIKPSLENIVTFGNEADEVLMPTATENPVITALKARGLYKMPLGSGKHDVTCPWKHEHTDAQDTGTAYFEPDEQYPVGGFCCQHSHRDKYHIKAFLDFLGIRNDQARHKPVIRIVPGDLHRVVDAAEMVLAVRGRHYQAGGLIVSVATNPVTGDPSIIPLSAPALTKEMSAAAIWEKFDGRADDWIRCDPPTRHIAILADAKTFHHLPPLAGVARQPYFRECDGQLVIQAGYDEASQHFGVFNPRQFPISEPTLEAARTAHALLEELLTEFHFVSLIDKAAAMAAIFTATVRPALQYAPAFHARAPVFGSGKSYLCDLIGCFAGPGGNSKVSYPTTSEEATKAIVSLLLTGPAVIEFDDMDTDWIPHGTIKRMLTTDQITDRILGASKTATVSTRTLFLGSGNNVGPVRDLLRRVITIHIDPRTATPAMMDYRGNPVEKVRKDRGRYVAAVLTIIVSWLKAGSPRTSHETIVTFGGRWSDYCRHPLMWLGHPDPATSLIDQVKHDPDADALRGLMREWQKAFGSSAVTVRKAVANALNGYPDLLDAMREFPVEDRGEINRSKLGWLLKKNANRIIDGFEFQKADADGRTAWRIIAVNSPAFPSSNASVLKHDTSKPLSEFEKLDAIVQRTNEFHNSTDVVSGEPPESAF